jgi:hypothetical protein
MLHEAGFTEIEFPGSNSARGSFGSAVDGASVAVNVCGSRC